MQQEDPKYFYRQCSTHGTQHFIDIQTKIQKISPDSEAFQHRLQGTPFEVNYQLDNDSQARHWRDWFIHQGIVFAPTQEELAPLAESTLETNAQGQYIFSALLILLEENQDPHMLGEFSITASNIEAVIDSLRDTITYRHY